MIRIDDIVEKVERNHPGADTDQLRRAYLFSAREHRGQVRKSGEPYLIHPLEVANILAEMKLDVTSVSTGLLHDVVEDTLTTLETIEEYFGKEVAHLVDGLTKIAKLNEASYEEQQAENLRKMLLAMVDDIRVILVKLADRLHNMRTLQYLPAEKRKRIAQETLDVYAPIAHRLGLARIRAELDNLSFKYLEPEEYEKLSKMVEQKRMTLAPFLDEIQKQIRLQLEAADIPVKRIDGRVKRLYSIYRKLKRQKITLNEVYDLVALRVITDSVKDCYAALGVIHNTWHPVPGRIKDWIAIPRDNLYQSLHTTVIGENGHPFEVQIRTEEMHLVAEEGIAAHWKYKEGIKEGANEEAFVWLRRLVEWQQEVQDSREFIDNLKIDLYPKEVYAFTPMGKVIELPRGATPIDFAYAIHSQVGDTCTGAKANGRIVPLKYQLRNGDRVEIITSPGHHPSRDWLSFVVTSKAKQKIKHYITEAQRQKSVEIGRKLFEKEADRFKLNTKKLLANGDLQKLAPEYGCQRPDDLFAHIGYGKITSRGLIQKLIPPDEFNTLEEKEKKPSTIRQAVKKVLRLGETKIKVKGIDDILVYRSKCCNPIWGEQIIGYITLGKGVAVHSVRCPNSTTLLLNKDRVIDVAWVKDDGHAAYGVTLRATTENKQGILAAITQAIANIKTDIRDARASVNTEGQGIIDITVEIFDLKHLERVMSAVKQVDGIIDVERQGTGAMQMQNA
ncbi:MAG TPA: bifunctional (p)ppGpp synthetase/guanosine-3',5'-bis(diphosphate) 3'-pyrophosphohydrolase [Blastocatellia bacterium]|nr:bifunctional (p)ppGpp synthetase/guanosine-3',5'-bis(diphosphate) 3'-pyrophosphohydrolase [Blastocatellia bacterium]